MEIKEYLKNISRVESHIEAKKQRIAILKDMAVSPTAPNVDGMPKNPNKWKSSMADAVTKYLELEDEIKADEISLEKKKVFIVELIGQLNNTEHQTVLIKRYFDKKSWSDIATDMFYTTRWIYKLHGSALEKLEEVYKNELQ